MRKTNSVFEVKEKSFDTDAVSRAEVRRLGWHLENLKIVRLGRFQSNFDELVTGNNEARLRNVPA